MERSSAKSSCHASIEIHALRKPDRFRRTSQIAAIHTNLSIDVGSLRRRFTGYRRSLVESRMRYLIWNERTRRPRDFVGLPKVRAANRMRYEGLGQTFHCAQCKNELPPLNEPVDARSDLVF